MLDHNHMHSRIHGRTCNGRRAEGVFLGIKATSGEYMVGYPKGVVKTRTIARKLVEEKWTPCST